jgi:RP/EB family microtubule-associated protein
VAFCQLLDAVYPGRVPLHRLDFNAQYVEAKERNLRVMRDTLGKLEIEVNVDLPGIANGKFQAGPTSLFSFP